MRTSWWLKGSVYVPMQQEVTAFRELAEGVRTVRVAIVLILVKPFTRVVTEPHAQALGFTIGLLDGWHITSP